MGLPVTLHPATFLVASFDTVEPGQDYMMFSKLHKQRGTTDARQLISREKKASAHKDAPPIRCCGSRLGRASPGRARSQLICESSESQRDTTPAPVTQQPTFRADPCKPTPSGNSANDMGPASNDGRPSNSIFIVQYFVPTKKGPDG